MAKVKKRYTKKKVRKMTLLTLCLVLLVLSLSYLILYTDILTPEINELTASYISFNNIYNTDVLKINYIPKMKDKYGKSRYNLHSINFNVKGPQKEPYNIILYPIGNNIDEKDVKFYLENNNKKYIDNLSSAKRLEDGGLVIYNGIINNEGRFTLRMWIDYESHQSIKNISYEVKIEQG